MTWLTILSRHGINVNAVAPGYTKSRMTEKIYSNDAFNEKLFKGIPAKRWGEAKDLASACVYLASPASDYVTGHCLVVDGGILGGPPIVHRDEA
jgi:2-deoxy-D-gluconate 3-dehydrogenase